MIEGKGSKLISGAALFGVIVGLILLLYFCFGIFVIQPIGAIPEGMTIIYWRVGLNLPFVASADGMLANSDAGVSLLGRGMMLATLAEPIVKRKILKLGYSEALYLWSTNGKKFERRVAQDVFDSDTKKQTPPPPVYPTLPGETAIGFGFFMRGARMTTDAFDQPRLIVEVINRSGASYSITQIQAIVYGSDGGILSTHSMYDGYVPGQSRALKFDFYETTLDAIKTYRVQCTDANP